MLRRLAQTAAAASVALIPLAVPAGSSAAPVGAYTTQGAYSFVSAPYLHPPKLTTTQPTRTAALAPGLLLTDVFPNVQTGKPMVGQGGPLILDAHLQPVWSYPVSTSVVSLDLKQQLYDGKPALSWWEGVINKTGAASSGTVKVVDQHYRPIATLVGDTKDGWVISPHEVVISGHDAWVTSYRYLPHQDFSDFMGPSDGTLYDSAVQKYDLRTGKLIYSWSAFNPGHTPHIPLSESESRPAPIASIPWDAYHVNSIQLIPGKSQFLVSMRNTWAAYLVDVHSGNVIWTLGGKASSYTLSPSAHFEYQHMVQLLPGGNVSLFDDHCCGIVAGAFQPPDGPTRGLVLHLDPSTHSASMVAQYQHDPALHAAFTGSTEIEPGGNVFVGWGSQPYFSEYSHSGAVLLDAHWPGPDLSYRILKANWVGLPSARPHGAVKTKNGHATVYASWNGATQVVYWRVLAGPELSKLAQVAYVNRRGFETAIWLRHTYHRYRVQALDGHGHVLRGGTSDWFPQPSSGGPGFY